MNFQITDPYERKAIMTWALVLIGTLAIMLLILLTGETSLNFTLVIFLIIVKFLAGFGIVMGIISLFLLILNKFETKFQGEENKKRMNNLIIGMVVLTLFLVIYQGPVKIYQSFVNKGDQDNLFDKLMFVYGIVSLMLNLYILPLQRDEFTVVTVITTGDMIKDSVQQKVTNVKKAFFRWKKDYAKEEIQEQTNLKQFFQVLRQRMAVIMMVFLGVGSLVFTPICAIFILMWLRIFFLTDRKPFRFEIYLLIIASIGLAVIAALIPFVLDQTTFYGLIKDSYFWIYIAQFCGVGLAAYMYLSKLLRPIIEKRRVQQVKDLKEEKGELEKERKALLKEKKELEKLRLKDSSPEKVSKFSKNGQSDKVPEKATKDAKNSKSEKGSKDSKKSK